jgi:CDP-4-dehydro-6-deoxyglucose reductase
VLDAALGAALEFAAQLQRRQLRLLPRRLLRGEIHYPNGRRLGLSDAEIAEGYILLCQARARGDLASRPSKSPPQQARQSSACRPHRARVPCRTTSWRCTAPARAEDFSFEAGQYIDIMLPGGRRRSFSIASPPHDARAAGAACAAGRRRRIYRIGCSEAGMRKALLTIEGPLGQFTYHRARAPRRVTACCSSAAAPGLRRCSASCGISSRTALSAT